MDAGELIDATGERLTADAPYREQLRVYYYRSPVAEPRIPFVETVLFQDDCLVAADKPHFLPVLPSGRYAQETLLTRLRRRLGIDTLTPVHRIDRDTAGVVLFAVQPAVRDAYQRLFRERRVEKIYEAIAPQPPVSLRFPLTRRSRLVESARFMQMHEADGEANAETVIELMTPVSPSATVAASMSPFARYRLRPLTGQKHQLRAHMAALGLPIVNDRIYPSLLAADDAVDFSRPLQLLARRIAFDDPLSGVSHVFESNQLLDESLI